MNATPARYRLASPGVVAEVIDGEAIIMHLGQGSYFSIDGAGAAVWTLLLDGATEDEAAREVAACAGASRDQVSAEVGLLVSRLLEEGLVERDPERPAPESLSVEGPLVYATPVLNKYGDMKEMLALDPPIPEFGP
jgi:hypothetical protein